MKTSSSKSVAIRILGALLLLLPAFLLSCITDSKKDRIVLSFELDSAKLGKSDSLRFEIYNGKAPSPGDTVKPAQVITVKTPSDLKVKITLTDKVASDFSVVVVAIGPGGETQRKLFEFDDFKPDPSVKPAVLLAVITAVDLDMKPGETRATALTLTPDDASDKRVVYTSSDTGVVKVVGSNKDSLRAVKDGSAKITVTAHVGGAKASFTITVSSKVALAAVEAKPLSGVVGDTLVPDLAFTPSDATDKTFQLKSLDTGVVTVAGLKVVARNAGSGKVVVTTTDGSLKDTFDVAVANKVIRLTAVDSKALSGLVGDTLSPELTFTPDEAADKSFALKSLDSSVAEIKGTKVFGKAEGKGKVVVTTTDGGLKDTFDVTVSKVAIRVKSVSGAGLRGLPGDTLVADLTFDPADATDKGFTLESLDTATVRILADQKIVAVKLGTGKVVVTTEDASRKDTFDVVVSRAAFKTDVLPITTLKCNPCHIPGQIFNFQDSSVLLQKGVKALDRLQRGPDVAGKMPLKGAPNGDLSARQLGVVLEWLNRNVVPLTDMTAKDMVLNLGDTAAPALTFAPSTASNQVATLTTLDSTIVSVTADNRLVPQKVGEASVLAQADETSKKATFKVKVEPPDFAKNVLPITTFKCAPCHVPGQTYNFQDSAFLIISGAQAIDRLQRDSLLAGKMPLRGAPNGDLSPQQKAILLAWLNTKVIPLKGITVPDDSVLVDHKKGPNIAYDPANASNKTYFLASADTAKVGIDGGEFVGVAVGTAQVEVRTLDGNFLKIINVKVKPVPVDSIRVPDQAGAIGDTISPEVEFFPANAALKTFVLNFPNATTVLSMVPGSQKMVCQGVGRDTIIASSIDGNRIDSFVVVVGPVLPKTLAVHDTNGVIGDKVTPKFDFIPVNTTNKALTYSIASGDTNIAAVRSIQIEAKALGKVNVTAVSQADTSVKDVFAFTVGPVLPTSITATAIALVCSTTVNGASFITVNPNNATTKTFTLALPAVSPARFSLPTATTAKALRLGAQTLIVKANGDTSVKANWSINVIRPSFTPFRNITQVKCIKCHSAGTINWTDSLTTVNAKDKIKDRITVALTGAKMPPAVEPQLTAAELKLLYDWVNMQ